MASVGFQVDNNGILVQGQVDSQPVTFLIDTGDAIGPTFNASDAQALKLPNLGPFEVSGAGGSVQIAATKADITLGSSTFKQEPSAIDEELQGPSLLGLPFFLRQGGILSFNFDTNLLEFGSIPSSRQNSFLSLLKRLIG